MATFHRLAHEEGAQSHVQGLPVALREKLSAERFYLTQPTYPSNPIDMSDEASGWHVLHNLSLRDFLVSHGATYLRRLTAASPIDTLSVTRTGDTIGCDHANWMVLGLSDGIDAAELARSLTTKYSKDILLATPCRKNARLLGHTPKVPGESLFGCQSGQRDMINVGTAWEYEVGHDSILVGGYDAGCDWEHPDLGGDIGPGHRIVFAWEYSTGTQTGALLQPGHGTACFGIMGANTNNEVSSADPSESVAGIAGGWSNLPPDPVNPDPTPNDGASMLIFADTSGSNDGFISLMFEAAAKSTTTDYGLGVHIMNIPAVFSWDADSEGTRIHAAINYLFENGVVIAAGRDDQNAPATMRPSYPACYDEPWVLNVGGSIPGKTKTPPCDYGYNMDLIAPSGSVDGCDTAKRTPLGWTINYTTKSDQPGVYTYGPFAGSSAAVSNVAASAALLRSHFLRLDPKHSLYLEPEDYAGILKASAWRGDADRSQNNAENSWRPLSGWGHLDIGKAFQMLDSDYNAYPYSAYHIQHYSIPFDPKTFDVGEWSKDSVKYYFNTPWAASNESPEFQHRDYLIDTESMPYYYAKMRVITRTDTLPDLWDITDSAPLFAWGRSGGGSTKSGWSSASENFQTGWSRVTNGSGGDSLNEGIFHTNRIITTETMQYDVWGYVDGHGWVKPLGHFPPDSVLGVNYTVFGRVKGAHGSVAAHTENAGSHGIALREDLTSNTLTASFFMDRDREFREIEIFDALGRLVESVPIENVIAGWNSMSIPSASLNSGMYVCRMYGEGGSQSKLFSMVK